ncbi:MAG TPA: ArsA-related P-loop ATPase [Acidimicrobiia bacterium]|nr:ArsA-related P-loop ATPase [Acidimicrobiia bacterium]
MSTAVVLVVGAGGVGKTTISAAIGADAARAGARTLVLTVDPARRLADALGIDVGNHPVEVPGMAGLSAAMLDAAASWEAIVRTHAAPDVAVRLVANPLFRAVADRFPSGQAYAAAEEMATHADSGEWDVLVVDTPPAAGGVDFLSAPRRMRALVAGRALRWLTGPRIPGRRALYAVTARPALRIADAVLGGPLLEDVAEFLLDLRETYDGISRRSKQVERVLREAAGVVVTTADPAPLLEAVRLFDEVPEWASPPRVVVFNRSLPAEWAHAVGDPGDPLDANLARWGLEAERQADVRAELAARHGVDPVVIPWMAEMPTDPEALADLAERIVVFEE